MSDHDNKCEFMLAPPDMNRLGLCLCKERALAARLGTDVCDYDYPPGTAPCMCQFRLVDSSGEPVAECDYHSKIRARLAEALFLLNRWHEAYHADGGMEMLDDDTTTWLAGISPFTPDSADAITTGEK